MFALPFEKVLFQGFYGFTWLGSETLAPLVLITLAWFVVSMIWFLTSDKVTKSLAGKIPWRTKTAAEAAPSTTLKETPKWVLWSILMALGAMIILLLFLVMLLLLKSGEFYGKKSAQKQEGRLSAAQYERTVTIKDGTTLKAKLITCSSTNCALLINGKAQVYRLEDIQSVTR